MSKQLPQMYQIQRKESSKMTSQMKHLYSLEQDPHNHRQQFCSSEGQFQGGEEQIEKYRVLNADLNSEIPLRAEIHTNEPSFTFQADAQSAESIAKNDILDLCLSSERMNIVDDDFINSKQKMSPQNLDSIEISQFQQRSNDNFQQNPAPQYYQNKNPIDGIQQQMNPSIRIENTNQIQQQIQGQIDGQISEPQHYRVNSDDCYSLNNQFEPNKRQPFINNNSNAVNNIQNDNDYGYNIDPNPTYQCNSQPQREVPREQKLERTYKGIEGEEFLSSFARKLYSQPNSIKQNRRMTEQPVGQEKHMQSFQNVYSNLQAIADHNQLKRNNSQHLNQKQSPQPQQSMVNQIYEPVHNTRFRDHEEKNKRGPNNNQRSHRVPHERKQSHALISLKDLQKKQDQQSNQGGLEQNQQSNLSNLVNNLQQIQINVQSQSRPKTDRGTQKESQRTSLRFANEAAAACIQSEVGPTENPFSTLNQQHVDHASQQHLPPRDIHSISLSCQQRSNSKRQMNENTTTDRQPNHNPTQQSRRSERNDSVSSRQQQSEQYYQHIRVNSMNPGQSKGVEQQEHEHVASGVKGQFNTIDQQNIQQSQQNVPQVRNNSPQIIQQQQQNKDYKYDSNYKIQRIADSQQFERKESNPTSQPSKQRPNSAQQTTTSVRNHNRQALNYLQIEERQEIQMNQNDKIDLSSYASANQNKRANSNPKLIEDLGVQSQRSQGYDSNHGYPQPPEQSEISCNNRQQSWRFSQQVGQNDNKQQIVDPSIPSLANGPQSAYNSQRGIQSDKDSNSALPKYNYETRNPHTRTVSNFENGQNQSQASLKNQEQYQEQINIQNMQKQAVSDNNSETQLVQALEPKIENQYNLPLQNQQKQVLQDNQQLLSQQAAQATQNKIKERLQFLNAKIQQQQQVIRAQKQRQEIDRQGIIKMKKSIKSLENRNEELNKSLLEAGNVQEANQQLETRCKRAEESLREETSINEKQRAEIRILQDGIEVRMKQVGIDFKNQSKGKQGFHDGCRQLLQQQQVIDQQKDKIEVLNDKFNTAEVKNLEQIQQLQASKAKELKLQDQHYTQQMDQTNRFINELKKDKSNLINDKVRNHLQIEELKNTNNQQEQLINELKCKVDMHQDNFKHISKKYDQTQAEKKNQAEKEQMRDMQVNELAEISEIQMQELEQIRETLKSKEEIEVQLLQQIQLLQDELQQIGENKQETEKSLKLSESQVMKDKEMCQQLETEIKNKDKEIHKYNSKILPDLKMKYKQLEDSKQELKQNLILTQNELEKLINFVEQSENKQAQSEEMIHQKEQELQEKLKLQQNQMMNMELQMRDKQNDIGNLNKLIQEAKQNSLNALKLHDQKMNDKDLTIKNLNIQIEQYTHSHNTQLQLNKQLGGQHNQLNERIEDERQLSQKLALEVENLRTKMTNDEKIYNSSINQLQLNMDQVKLEKRKIELQFNQLKLAEANKDHQQISQQYKRGHNHYSEQQLLPLNYTNELSKLSPIIGPNTPHPDLTQQFKQILKNIQYFSESVNKIDNVQERFTLLHQFTQDEHYLRSLTHQLDQVGKSPSPAYTDILHGLEQCFNCVFQTVFQLVLESEQSELDIKEKHIAQSYRTAQSCQTENVLQLKCLNVQYKQEIDDLVLNNQGLKQVKVYHISLIKQLANPRILHPELKEHINKSIKLLNHLQNLQHKSQQRIIKTRESEQKLQILKKNNQINEQELQNLQINIIDREKQEINANQQEIISIEKQIDEVLNAIGNISHSLTQDPKGSWQQWYENTNMPAIQEQISTKRSGEGAQEHDDNLFHQQSSVQKMKAMHRGDQRAGAGGQQPNVQVPVFGLSHQQRNNGNYDSGENQKRINVNDEQILENQDTVTKFLNPIDLNNLKSKTESDNLELTELLQSDPNESSNFRNTKVSQSKVLLDISKQILKQSRQVSENANNSLQIEEKINFELNESYDKQSQQSHRSSTGSHSQSKDQSQTTKSQRILQKCRGSSRSNSKQKLKEDQILKNESEDNYSLDGSNQACKINEIDIQVSANRPESENIQQLQPAMEEQSTGRPAAIAHKDIYQSYDQPVIRKVVQEQQQTSNDYLLIQQDFPQLQGLMQRRGSGLNQSQSQNSSVNSSMRVSSGKQTPIDYKSIYQEELQVEQEESTVSYQNTAKAQYPGQIPNESQQQESENINSTSKQADSSIAGQGGYGTAKRTERKNNTIKSLTYQQQELDQPSGHQLSSGHQQSQTDVRASKTRSIQKLPVNNTNYMQATPQASETETIRTYGGAAQTNNTNSMRVLSTVTQKEEMDKRILNSKGGNAYHDITSSNMQSQNQSLTTKHANTSDIVHYQSTAYNQSKHNEPATTPTNKVLQGIEQRQQFTVPHSSKRESAGGEINIARQILNKSKDSLIENSEVDHSSMTSKRGSSNRGSVGAAMKNNMQMSKSQSRYDELTNSQHLSKEPSFYKEYANDISNHGVSNQDLSAYFDSAQRGPVNNTSRSNTLLRNQLDQNKHMATVEGGSRSSSHCSQREGGESSSRVRGHSYGQRAVSQRQSNADHQGDGSNLSNVDQKSSIESIHIGLDDINEGCCGEEGSRSYSSRKGNEERSKQEQQLVSTGSQQQYLREATSSRIDQWSQQNQSFQNSRRTKQINDMTAQIRPSVRENSLKPQKIIEYKNQSSVKEESKVSRESIQMLERRTLQQKQADLLQIQDLSTGRSLQQYKERMQMNRESSDTQLQQQQEELPARIFSGQQQQVESDFNKHQDSKQQISKLDESYNNVLNDFIIDLNADIQKNSILDIDDIPDMSQSDPALNIYEPENDFLNDSAGPRSGTKKSLLSQRSHQSQSYWRDFDEVGGSCSQPSQHEDFQDLDQITINSKIQGIEQMNTPPTISNNVEVNNEKEFSFKNVRHQNYMQ